MATTTMRHMPARPLVFMGPAISITAFSSGWVHGLAGAIATVGAAIASATAVEEDITEEAVWRPIEDMQVAHR